MFAHLTKIAFVNRVFGQFGGTERVTFALIEEQLRRGTADLLYIEGGGEVLSLPPSTRTIKLAGARMLNCVRPLATYLRQERPEALVVSSWPLTVYAVAARLLSGAPTRLILCEHNTLSLQYAEVGLLRRLALRTSISVAYPLADARVAVSRGVANDLAQLGGISTSSISVIENPVRWIAGQENVADVSDIPVAWRNFPGARVLTVGHLKPQKNHRLLVQAFARLSRQREAALMIVGAGEEEAEIRRAAVDECVADRVFFAGSVVNPAPFYASADLFVLSSNYEGFGLVLVEALQFGLPIVSTDCKSGPASILENGKYGALTPVNDDEALAIAMQVQLDSPGDREARIARAKEYLPEKAAARYWELTDGGKRPAAERPVSDS